MSLFRTRLSSFAHSLVLFGVAFLTPWGGAGELAAQNDCTGPPAPRTPFPLYPGDLPRIPGSPGTPTGWPFSGGTTNPGTPGAPMAPSAEDLFRPSWLSWWRTNDAGYLGLRGYVHRPPYRGGDVISFQADRSRASKLAPYFPTADVVKQEVLPRLEAMLEREKDSLVERALLLAIARAGRALEADDRLRLVRLLEGRLGHKNRDVSVAATIGLGWLGHRYGALALGELAQESGRTKEWFRRGKIPLETRLHAILGLGTIAAEGNDDVQRYVLSVLRRVIDLDEGGEENLRVTALVAASLASPEWSGAPDAATRKGTFEAESDRLLALFLDRDEHFSVRAQALTTWSLWIADLDPHVRRVEKGRFLPLVLGRMRNDLDTRLVEALVVALGNVVDDDDDPLDQRAVDRLLNLGTLAMPRATESRRWMELARIAARSGDAATSGRTLDRVTEALVERLIDGHAEERPWVALALGRLALALHTRREDIGDPVRQALRVRLTSKPAGDEVACLCLALGMARDTRALSLLEDRVTKGSQPRVRRFAALGLGFLGDPKGLPIVRDALPRTLVGNASLEEAVSYARTLLEDRDVALGLLDGLESLRQIELQLARLGTVSEIGDRRSFQPLFSLAEGKRPAVLRAAAVSAVGRIAEPDLQSGGWRYGTDTSRVALPPTVVVALEAH